MSQIVSSHAALAAGSVTERWRLEPGIYNRPRQGRRLNPPGRGRRRSCDDGGDNSRRKVQNVLTDSGASFLK